MNYQWDWSIFFKPTGIGEEIYLHWFISGLMWTLALSLCGWLIALLLGSLLGTMRTLPNRWLAGLSAGYVNLFRNTPLLVQLFIWYFLVPDILPESIQTWLKQDLSPEISGFLIVTICLGLFTAARVCEQVRTGIEALPHGQRQAASALGLSVTQTYRRVLLPQAFRIVIPPLTSEFLNIIKNSSVASLVGLMELLAQTKQTGEFTANLFEAFTMATLIYFTVNMGGMLAMSKLERKLRVPGLIALGGK